LQKKLVSLKLNKIRKNFQKKGRKIAIIYWRNLIIVVFSCIFLERISWKLVNYFLPETLITHHIWYTRRWPNFFKFFRLLWPVGFKTIWQQWIDLTTCAQNFLNILILTDSTGLIFIWNNSLHIAKVKCKSKNRGKNRSKISSENFGEYSPATVTLKTLYASIFFSSRMLS
jgi:hypothetical protein